jgi:hypothetical protein
MKKLCLLPLLLLFLSACSGSRPGAEEEAATVNKDRAAYEAEPIIQRLRRIPSITFTPSGEVRVRNSPYPPLLVVDGLPIRGSDLSFLNPVDVDQIKVLTMTESAIYGMEGVHGVIVFTTKRFAVAEE